MHWVSQFESTHRFAYTAECGNPLHEQVYSIALVRSIVLWGASLIMQILDDLHLIKELLDMVLSRNVYMCYQK